MSCKIGQYNVSLQVKVKLKSNTKLNFEITNYFNLEKFENQVNLEIENYSENKTKKRRDQIMFDGNGDKL